MLKRLFTSNARIKILTIFLMNPDEEYFIRELTRKLDEQINSIRRELDNLKKIGLLKVRNKNRKKYYYIDKSFILFPDLRNLFMKSLSSKDNFVKKIQKCGEVSLLVMSGIFVDKESQADLLIVGTVDREKVEQFLNYELNLSRPVKFSIMPKDEFLYRWKCRDRFVKDFIEDGDNIIGVNKLEKEMG